MKRPEVWIRLHCVNTAARLDFHTFFGRFKIDPDTGRQLGRSVFLVQWQQGSKVVIWPPEQARGKLLSL